MQTSNSIKQIAISAVLTEAWKLISGLKWIIFKRGMLSACCSSVPIAIYFIAAMIIFGPLEMFEQIHAHPFYLNCITVAVATLQAYIWIPAIMCGVRQAIGLPMDMSAVKKEISQVKSQLRTLIFLLLIVYMAVLQVSSLLMQDHELMITMLLHYASFFFLIPVFIFAIPLIIIKKFDAFTAVDNAYGKMMYYWKEIIGSYLVIGLITFSLQFMVYLMKSPVLLDHIVFSFLLMIMLSTCATIWLMPLTFTIAGVLFRDVYGLKVRNI